MVIDLRKLAEPLAADIFLSQLAFSAQHINMPISTVEAVGRRLSWYAWLHLDTP